MRFSVLLSTAMLFAVVDIMSARANEERSLVAAPAVFNADTKAGRATNTGSAGPQLTEAVLKNEVKKDGDVEPFTEQQTQEIDRIVKAALAAQKSEPSNFGADYKNGFRIRGGERKTKDSPAPFEMRVNSWIQFRHTVLDADVGPSQNDLELERLRMSFQGHAYSPDLQYFIQFDGDSDQGEVLDWLDYYITSDVGHAAGGDVGSFGVKFGKWKLPFSRARAESGWKLQFADRSMASVFFDINRSQAVAVFGKFGLLSRDVEWESAISNGFKTEGFQPGRSGDLDQNFGYSARVWSDWIGEWGTDGESDLNQHECLAMRVGSGFAFTHLERQGARESGGQRVVDSGAPLTTLIPAAVSGYDLAFYALDANWKYRGTSLLTEYYFRSLGNFRGGAVSDLFDHGFLVQAGTFVIPQKLELMTRWSRIVGDSGTLGASRESSDEVAGGFVWYLKGHQAKITFDVTRLNGAPIRDTSLNILPGDDGFLYRTQLQLYF